MDTCYVIGIAGGTAGGKATFCETLSKLLERQGFPTADIHVDDYFKPVDERPVSEAPVSGKKYTDDNHPDTMDLKRIFRYTKLYRFRSMLCNYRRRASDVMGEKYISVT